MEYASSGALGALDVGFTICVFVQALCPKLDRRPNVMHAGEARDHGRMNLYHCVDMRNDVLAGFNPGNGLAGIDYDFGGVSLCLRFRDSRLSERGASGRVKSWAILEDSRLSKSWLELEEKREKGVFQEQGALGLILELAKREILRLEAVSVELEKLPRTKPNTHRGVDLRKGKYVVNRRMEYASSGALGALDVGFTICVFVL
ncbi:hypothetical protein Lal_00011968 [Lupinus albus]|nr:hypothetical protein Lal_00011968 [Lupinus albus]